MAVAAAAAAAGGLFRASASASASHEQIIDVFVAVERSGTAEHGRGHEGGASSAAHARRQERRGQQRRRGRGFFDRGSRHGDALPGGQELAVGSLAAEAGHELVDQLLGRAGGPVDVGREGGGELVGGGAGVCVGVFGLKFSS